MKYNQPDCSTCSNNENGFCTVGRMPAIEFYDLDPRKGGCYGIKHSVKPVEEDSKEAEVPEAYRWA